MTDKPKPYTRDDKAPDGIDGDLAEWCAVFAGAGESRAVDVDRFWATVEAADALRGALEALVAGVEDTCLLWERCDVQACNCGKEHLNELGERVRRARRALGWEKP